MIKRVASIIYEFSENRVIIPLTELNLTISYYTILDGEWRGSSV